MQNAALASTIGSEEEGQRPEVNLNPFTDALKVFNCN
jgi:hypothetical protein